MSTDPTPITTTAPFGLIERYETEVARLRIALALIADAKRFLPMGQADIITAGCISVAEKALNGDEHLVWVKG